MKEQILTLRQQGKSYKQIAQVLNCAKSTVAYYCNTTTKEKQINSTKKLRANNSLIRKLDTFKSRKNIVSKTRDFQRRTANGKTSKADLQFTAKELNDVLAKNPFCYLTGRPINLKEPSTYALDHKIPVSKGGDNSISNLGLATKHANMAKYDLTVEEFISLCKDVLTHNGYKVADS